MNDTLNIDILTDDLRKGVVLYTKDIHDFFVDYTKEFHGDLEYYYILRVLPLMIEYDHNIFKTISKKYKDEQFCKVAYDTCSKVYEHLTFLQRIYVQANLLAKVIKSIVKMIKVNAAILK